MYDYNNYNEERTPTEVTYYPAGEVPKKRHNVVLKWIMAFVCIAAVSAGSIGAYAAVTGGDSKNGEPENNISASAGNSGFTSQNEIQTSRNPAEVPSLIELASRENSLTIPEIIQKVTPSVVGVSSTHSAGTATGTGIVMSADGYIITNAHVISEGGRPASRIMVLLEDNSEHYASVVGFDSKTDLAVIKIDASGLVPAEFGKSDELMVGELAVAIGNPLGFELSNSATCGIISALNREITIDDRAMTLIQTDAAINPGNSGGPLVNSYGQVIGINSAKISSEYAEGLGFAIPISDAVPIINDLISNGYVTGRPQIGITGENITALMSRYYQLPQGVYVRMVSKGSAAFDAGILAGDVIIGINGETISTMSELNKIKDEFQPGDAIMLTVYRNGLEFKATVVLGEATN